MTTNDVATSTGGVNMTTAPEAVPDMSDWLTVGARVAAITRTGRHSVKHSTVAKIGKRDVVLADGQRFNAATRRRRVGGTCGWTVELVSADDPAVARLSAEIRVANIRAKALSAVHDFCLGAGRDSDPLPVIRAMAALLPDEQRDAVLNAVA